MTDPRELQDAARRAVAHAVEVPAPGTARGAVEAVRALQVEAPGSAEVATIARETAGPMFEIDGAVGRWWGTVYDALAEALEDEEFVAVLVARSDLEILRTVYRDVVDEARLAEFETRWVDEMIRAVGDDHGPIARKTWVPESHWWWDWSAETPARLRHALDTGDAFDVVFRIRRLRERVAGTDGPVARIVPLWWERARDYLLADEIDRDVFLARIARSNLERVRESYPDAVASLDTVAFDEELHRLVDGGGWDGGGVPPLWVAGSEYAQHWWWGREA